MPLLALLAIWARGESPKIESVLLEVLGVLLFAAAALASRRLLHGLLGWWRGRPRRILRAGFLVRGGGCRRCCTRGRRIRRPGCVFGRHGAGRERLPSPHGKPPQTVSRCVVGVFFVTIGLQLDGAQILSAPLAVFAWLAVLVPVKIGSTPRALRATRLSALDASRTHSVGACGEFALLLLGMVLQQHLIPATVVQPMLVALVLSMALAPLLIRHHDVLASVLEPHRRRHSATPC